MEGKAKRNRTDERAVLTWPSSSKMSHDSVGICARCGRAVCGAPSLYVLNHLCGGLQQTGWVSLWSELAQLRETAGNAMLFGSSNAGMRAEREADLRYRAAEDHWKVADPSCFIFHLADSPHRTGCWGAAPSKRARCVLSSAAAAASAPMRDTKSLKSQLAPASSCCAGSGSDAEIAGSMR